MRDHLNYKNTNKIRILLIQLVYGKVIEWTKNLGIYLIITGIVTIEYLIYYYNFMSKIWVLISYQFFTSYLVYILTSHYLTNYLDKPELDK